MENVFKLGGLTVFVALWSYLNDWLTGFVALLSYLNGGLTGFVALWSYLICELTLLVALLLYSHWPRWGSSLPGLRTFDAQPPIKKSNAGR